MRKPVNRFAVALWIVAALVAVLNFTDVLDTLKNLSNDAQEPSAVVVSLASVLSGMLVPVAQLVAFGAIIEILDQIRWDARNRK